MRPPTHSPPPPPPHTQHTHSKLNAGARREGPGCAWRQGGGAERAQGGARGAAAAGADRGQQCLRPQARAHHRGMFCLLELNIEVCGGGLSCFFVHCSSSICFSLELRFSCESEFLPVQCICVVLLSPLSSVVVFRRYVSVTFSSPCTFGYPSAVTVGDSPLSSWPLPPPPISSFYYPLPPRPPACPPGSRQKTTRIDVN